MNYRKLKVNDDFESKTEFTTKIENLDKKQAEVDKCIKVNCNN
jgi:ribonuclease Y